MCNPAFFAAGISMGQSAISGDSAARSLNTNASYLDAQRRDSLTRGMKEISKKHDENLAIQGAQRAGMGASGFDVNTGSSARVQADTVMSGAMDEQTIRSNMLKEAWGFQVQADMARKQAEDAGALGRLMTLGFTNGKIGSFKTFLEPWRAGMNADYINTGKVK